MEESQSAAYEAAVQLYRRAVMSEEGGEGGGVGGEEGDEKKEGENPEVVVHGECGLQRGEQSRKEEGEAASRREAAVALQQMPKKQLASIFTHLRKVCR